VAAALVAVAAAVTTKSVCRQDGELKKFAAAR
jgi:hypothetical protein